MREEQPVNSMQTNVFSDVPLTQNPYQRAPSDSLRNRYKLEPDNDEPLDKKNNGVCSRCWFRDHSSTRLPFCLRLVFPQSTQDYLLSTSCVFLLLISVFVFGYSSYTTVAGLPIYDYPVYDIMQRRSLSSDFRQQIESESKRELHGCYTGLDVGSRYNHVMLLQNITRDSHKKVSAVWQKSRNDAVLNMNSVAYLHMRNVDIKKENTERKQNLPFMYYYVPVPWTVCFWMSGEEILLHNQAFLSTKMKNDVPSMQKVKQWNKKLDTSNKNQALDSKEHYSYTNFQDHVTASYVDEIGNTIDAVFFMEDAFCLQYFENIKNNLMYCKPYTEHSEL
jgi:hypothetical protein